MTKIAIIGAGLAGLSLARSLPSRFDITMFEKSRGIGGRMATRYAGDFEFDHGAQYFTARTDAFRVFSKAQLEAGRISLWDSDVAQLNGARETRAEKFVASPRMNTLCKALAEDLRIQKGVRIDRLARATNQWQLFDTDGLMCGEFDWVATAAPAPQAAALLPDGFSGQSVLRRVRMAGCFALMLGFEQSVSLPWAAARVDGSAVGWIALNSAKPGRETACSVLIQSSNAWAEAHLEDDPAVIQRALLTEASALTGVDLGAADHVALHRWRYASTPKPAEQDFLVDANSKLAACGDWCLGSKVEAAYTSGRALGQHLASIL